MWVVKIFEPNGSITYWRNKGKHETDINNAKTFKLKRDAEYRANDMAVWWLEPKDRARGVAVEVTVSIKEKNT